MIRRFLPEKGSYIIQTCIFLRYKKWKLHKKDLLVDVKSLFCFLNAPKGPSRKAHSALNINQQEINFKDVIPLTKKVLTRINTNLIRRTIFYLGLKFISFRFEKVWVKMNLKKDTVSISLHFNGFTYYLTLFSEYFSSFPHGTCSLSVSC